MSPRLLSLLVLVGSLWAAAVVAVPHGSPLLQRFTSRDHHASAANVEVVAGPDGSIYVGNAEGLLHFDGNHWELLELPARSIARSMALGNDGRLYVGSYDRFGVVERDDTGKLDFVDLRERFGIGPGSDGIGLVWSVVQADNGIYFYTERALYWLGDDGGTRSWPLEGNVRAPFVLGAQVYARVHERGLARLVEDAFVPVEGGETFATRPLYNMFATADGVLAIGDDGFYRLDESGLRLLPGTAGAVFAEHPPYSGLQLPDGGFVFGSYAGQLLHFGPDLKLLSSHPISSDNIFDLELDREGGLWAATSVDLLRLRFPSPWSLHDPGAGLVGSVYASEWHADSLWVATSRGVMRSRTEDGATRFDLAIETRLEASDIEPDPDGLLYTDRFGVQFHRFADGRNEDVLELNAPSEMRRSRIDPDRVYVLAQDEIALLRRERGGWRLHARLPLENISLFGFVERAADELWLGDSRGGVERWRLDADGALVERRTFGPDQGLQVDPEFGATLESLDGELYSVSARRVFRLDGERFIPAPGQEPFSLVDRPFELQIAENPMGAFAFSPRRLLWRPRDSRQWQPALPGGSVSGGFSNVQHHPDGMLRIATWDGLLQFDPGIVEPALPPLVVGLHMVQLRAPDGSARRLPLQPAEGVQVLPAQGSLLVDFRMPSMEPGIQYRLRVLGMFEDFSDWTTASNPALTLRVPGPGEYTLEVEGRTSSGRTGTPLSYRFSVAPQWWQRPFAKISGIVLGILAVAALVTWILRRRYRRYLELNRQLEAKIAARTAELEAANRKLAELATEDGLTGVANRRALEQAMAREWDRCQELGQSLALAIVDIDHFKEYNDRHGHLVGDELLVKVAGLLKLHARPVRELLARFGGEEFVLVLPGTSLDAARDRAETMRATLEAESGGPTISVGVAAAVPGQGDLAGPTDILQRADAALYEAKRNGRNRVEVAV